MTKWFSLQVDATKIEDELTTSMGALNIAKQAYQAAAPFGLGSELFANDDDKKYVQNLRAKLKTKKSEFQDIENRQLDNEKSQQDFARIFLRACLANIENLRTSKVFGDRVNDIVEEITSFLEDQWGHYNNCTSLKLSDIDSNVLSLRNMYRKV